MEQQEKVKEVITLCGNLMSECEKLFREHAPALLPLLFRNNISHISRNNNSRRTLTNSCSSLRSHNCIPSYASRVTKLASSLVPFAPQGAREGV